MTSRQAQVLGLLGQVLVSHFLHAALQIADGLFFWAIFLGE